MFETKKSLRRRLDFYLGKCERAEETDRLFKAIHEIDMNALEKQTDRINELLEANGQLKRDLDLESRQKEELSELLAEAKRDAHCPKDCKNRKNPNACRTCTRYPNAKDKYEVE